MRTKLSQIAVWPLLKRTVAEWSEDKAPKMAASLAFYTATSIAPLVVAVLGVFTLVVHKKVDPRQLHEKLVGYAGKDIANVLQVSIDKAATGHSGVWATILGTALAMFSASALFGELQDSLNTIWEVKPKPDRGIWGTIQDRFLSLTMVLGIAFLLLVSTVLTGVVTGLSGSFFSFLGFETTTVAKSVVWVATYLITTGIVTLLFAAMFKILPDVHVRWRDVWLGGLLTALLFQVGKFVLTMYVNYAAPGSAFGAFGSIVVMLVWVDYSAYILFFGAEFTQVFTNEYGSRAVPTANAMPLTEAMRQQAGIAHAHAPDSPSHPDNLAAQNRPRPHWRTAPPAPPSTAGKGVVLSGLSVAVGLVVGRLVWHRYKAAQVHGPEIMADWESAAHKWKRLAKLFVSKSADRFAMTHGPDGRAGPTWADLSAGDVRQP